jgi:ferredoxin
MAVAPAIFQLGSAGYSRVVRDNLTEEDLDLLRDAEQGCPTQAIMVEMSEDVSKADG